MGDGCDVVGGWALWVWEFEVLVDGFSAPGAGEVLAGEECLALAAVCAVAGAVFHSCAVAS